MAAVAGTLAMSVSAAGASDADAVTEPSPDLSLVAPGPQGVFSAEPGDDLPVDSGEIDLFIAPSAAVAPGTASLVPPRQTAFVPLVREAGSAALDLD